MFSGAGLQESLNVLLKLRDDVLFSSFSACCFRSIPCPHDSLPEALGAQAHVALLPFWAPPSKAR